MIPVNKCNAAGIALIKESEGCSLRAYKDQGGVWTVGWGSTSNVKPGMAITQSEAERRLLEDVGIAENVVYNQIKAVLNENQFSALVSFTFNEGPGHLRASTLEQLLNSSPPDYMRASNALLLWDKCRGNVVPGLERRREAERALFLS